MELVTIHQMAHYNPMGRSKHKSRARGVCDLPVLTRQEGAGARQVWSKGLLPGPPEITTLNAHFWAPPQAHWFCSPGSKMERSKFGCTWKSEDHCCRSALPCQLFVGTESGARWKLADLVWRCHFLFQYFISPPWWHKRKRERLHPMVERHRTCLQNPHQISQVPEPSEPPVQEQSLLQTDDRFLSPQGLSRSLTVAFVQIWIIHLMSLQFQPPTLLALHSWIWIWPSG